MSTVEWAGRKSVEVEKETIGLEKKEEERRHVEREVSEACAREGGKATQWMNGCQVSLFSGGSQTWKKVLLPQMIKYTPHPETAEKKINTTTSYKCSQGKKSYSKAKGIHLFRAAL